MGRKNLIGVVTSLAIFACSFLLTGAAGAYFNLAAFLVVISGLCAAMLISYPVKHV
jgi:chemotaxis protein MotA